MIVMDASTLVGAAVRSGSPPHAAFHFVLDNDTFALSSAVCDEIIDVLHRPKLARFLDTRLRDEVVGFLLRNAVWFVPAVPVNDCRDPTDNKYLELALAASASAIITSDNDLLVLDPWRGTRILNPASYLTAGSANP